MFQQDPLPYVSIDNYFQSFGFYFQEEKPFHEIFHHQNADVLETQAKQNHSSSPSMVRTLTTTVSSSSLEKNFSGYATFAGEFYHAEAPRIRPQKRRRTRSERKKEEIENQRMTHIAVERNRRRQMNDHLSVLKSMMPSYFTQRGDQASIVGGAINFLKELEQILQSLEAQIAKTQRQNLKSFFSDFFIFPQYTTAALSESNHSHNSTGKSLPTPLGVAEVEATMLESHANVKVLTRNKPGQLYRIVSGFYSLGLTILHLNLTTAHRMVFYSFSVKAEDQCRLTSGNEIASAVQEMVRIIQEEAEFS